MPTMATPLSTARRKVVRVRIPGRRKPKPAQISSRVAAPNTQRQNTTSSTGCPDTSTNQPMVPEINMAAVISSEPRRNNLSMITLLNKSQKYDNRPLPRSRLNGRLKSAYTFFIKVFLRFYLMRLT
ncbi:hypothetical protein EMIT0373P_10366 [Pseudomonas chlororaphis]